jgi:uncharacterized protein
MNLRPILEAVLNDYALSLTGDHGISHWARVLENGLRLAPETGANVYVVSLFAVLHDSRRINECSDPQHGPRAAEFALQLHGKLFELNDHDLELLYLACEGHTHERTHSNVTIQTCWDSDRLDIGRVGATLDPRWLSTAAAQRREIMTWADGRARFRVVPALVQDEWGVDLHSPELPDTQ